jgi:phosphoribosylanthranilate isomerase
VLFSNSLRSVSPDVAREIFSSVGPFTTTVAVTNSKDPRHIEEILALHPCAVQVPGDADIPPAAVHVIRAYAPGETPKKMCDAVIVDGSHGRGTPFDPAFVKRLMEESPVPVILAGGLNPENVGDALSSITPYAVDVASGVESGPGIKDPLKIIAFAKACRRCAHVDI